MVIVSRTEYAIKALVPLEMIIEAISIAFLNKFVLEPIINPVAEKFNWVKAVKALLQAKIQPFKLVINIEDDKLQIETSAIYNASITANIWNTIARTLRILQNEHLLGKVSKVRFSVSKDDKLIIGCYKNEKILCLIDINQNKTIPIVNK